MPSIRPVSDLRNHFAEITKEVQESREPVFLTKNGVGSIVVMSMESYEQNRYDSMVYDKLREAEIQAASTDERFSHEDVMAKARERIARSEAMALLDELDKTVRQLSEFPYSCELYRTDRPMKDEIRKVPIRGYVLYYAVFQDRVEIRRFLHGRRDRTKDSLFR